MDKFDPNDPIHLSLTLTGDGVNDNFDLRAFATILYQFTRIMDESYCIILGRSRLNQDLKSSLNFRATSIHRNSIHIDFDLILNTLQLVAPVLGLANPYTIWEYVVYSYNVLKSIGLFRKKNVTPTIQNKTGDQAIIIQNSEITVNDPIILDVGAHNLSRFKDVTNAMQSNNIDEFSVTSDSDKINPLQVNKSDSELLHNPCYLQSDLLSLKVKIEGFNTKTKTGRLWVFPDQKILSGRYTFSLLDNTCSINPYIDAMKLDSVIIKSLPEVSITNASKTILKPQRLHILSME